MYLVRACSKQKTFHIRREGLLEESDCEEQAEIRGNMEGQVTGHPTGGTRGGSSGSKRPDFASLIRPHCFKVSPTGSRVEARRWRTAGRRVGGLGEEMEEGKRGDNGVTLFNETGRGVLVYGWAGV